MQEIIQFITNSILGGVIGNTSYDSIKALLGDKFDKLVQYLKENKKETFKIELEKILNENKKLREELLSLQQNKTKINQTHYGNGDNINGKKIIIYKNIYHEKMKDEINLLLFKIGWNAFSYLNLPNDKKLCEKVENNLFTMVIDLGIINKNELKYLNGAKLIDTIGNRIKSRLGERSFAVFMIGVLSPSSVEHYNNQNFKNDMLVFCKKIHKINVCEEIFRMAHEYHDIDKIYNFIIEVFGQSS
jgi:hypothetical protein